MQPSFGRPSTVAHESAGFTGEDRYKLYERFLVSF